MGLMFLAPTTTKIIARHAAGHHNIAEDKRDPGSRFRIADGHRGPLAASATT